MQEVGGLISLWIPKRLISFAHLPLLERKRCFRWNTDNWCPHSEVDPLNCERRSCQEGDLEKGRTLTGPGVRCGENQVWSQSCSSQLKRLLGPRGLMIPQNMLSMFYGFWCKYLLLLYFVVSKHNEALQHKQPACSASPQPGGGCEGSVRRKPACLRCDTLSNTLPCYFRRSLLISH